MQKNYFTKKYNKNENIILCLMDSFDVWEEMGVYSSDKRRVFGSIWVPKLPQIAERQRHDVGLGREM